MREQERGERTLEGVEQTTLMRRCKRAIGHHVIDELFAGDEAAVEGGQSVRLHSESGQGDDASHG